MSDQEKITYLVETLRNIARAIDNEAPDLALWEIRRAVKQLEEWDGQ